MKLLADSGSTKCDWALVTPDGKEYFHTLGLNPNILSPEQFIKILRDSKGLQSIKHEVTQIEFYGSGCSTQNQTQVASTLKAYFNQAQSIEVENDLMAAAKSTCKNLKGYVAILGTGSNLGYYDGKTLSFPIPSLGYLLADHGSGNAIGKRLIKDYFYGQMPQEYAAQLNWNIQELYTSERPNYFLANKVLECDFMQDSPYFNQIISEEFDSFFGFYLSVLKKDDTIHFVGSIAKIFEEILRKQAHKHGLSAGIVIQKPILYLE